MEIRAFHCYISSIFLYNSELWILKSATISSIDSFHRKLLRKACLNIEWPNKISNKDLYESTKVEPWSQSIIKRQLSWFGHLLRLPDDSPARLALNYALKPMAKPRGRQATTWISMMQHTSHR